MKELPLIDVEPLRHHEAAARVHVARQIEQACRESGFFYATGHGIPRELLNDLIAAAWRFFRLSEARKQTIAMHRGGPAWRGWFPVDGELTSGRPDHKEGVYFGEELSTDDARVRAGTPMHGANLFPEDEPALRPLVLEYLSRAALTAHSILEGIALSLGLDAQYFRTQYTARPTMLFRIFHYPAKHSRDDGWGVGEHTDYGLLTLLAQDDTAGLQINTRRGWIDALPVPGALVCNIGDMLDRLTRGMYRSTPHRVRSPESHGRLSFPFFFDPAFDAQIVPLPGAPLMGESQPGERWDGANVHEFSGTYGDYLLGKVSKVFPELKRTVIG